ncbi:cbb3-type cytochrome c oxidase subunit II [Candidatus Rubidus massiliensis]|nr:MAG: cytochrome oxidase [Chlamydia sp. 32-24]CDZ79843.1 cbb3-type cytochrome c oxidase subunit II [Candidatus Rubidus massiliensis]
MSEKNSFYKIEKSALITIIGIIFLFSFSIAIVLLAPRHIDPTWTMPTSAYQVQMYEISDPNIYISSSPIGRYNLQFIQHLKRNFTLLAFHENSLIRIIAPKELERYVTKLEDKELKLTSRLLMLKTPHEEGSGDYKPVQLARTIQQELQEEWKKEHPLWKEKEMSLPAFEVLELYEVEGDEAFSMASSDELGENWIDEDYKILDEKTHFPYHQDPGVIYVNNPREYRISHYNYGKEEGWKYDPNGSPIKSLDELKNHKLGFRSKKELIALGEQIYAAEGCWYCHTDQTRTLIQDVVLNGAAEFPSPPSSANEYIFQQISFPGTKRNGPDLSRTGIKKPSRDWHKGHFWSPQTASKGSIMPSFRHFFDEDPRGTAKSEVGIPNYKFEAIYQYLMTKGTRITSPNLGWWIGKDPVKTIEIIEGQRNP